jgi:hypothetical protein
MHGTEISGRALNGRRCENASVHEQTIGHGLSSVDDFVNNLFSISLSRASCVVTTRLLMN